VGKITKEVGIWGQANVIRWEQNSKTDEKNHPEKMKNPIGQWVNDVTRKVATDVSPR
jgi:hypothetical protein